MKKAIYSLCTVSLLLTVAACHKKDDIVTAFPEPATKEQAVNIVFDQGETLLLDLPDRGPSGRAEDIKSDGIASLDITSIELTEDSHYILYMDKKLTKGADMKTIGVWSGRYAFDKDLKKYILQEVGEITLIDKGCRIRPLAVKASYGDPIEMAATVLPMATTSTVAANLARTWKVASTYISLKGGKNEVNFSKGFTGCDLYEIGKYAKDMKVSLSNDDLAALQGYKVQEMMLEGNNSIIITFDSKDSYYGSYTANGTSFSWSLNNSNKILSAQASGTVGFPKNGQTELVLYSVISSGSETYNGTFTFTLEPVN